MRRALRLALWMLGIAAAPVLAQEADVLSVRAARRDTIVAASTVTVPFTVANRSGDIVHVRPLVRAPADWRVLMGTTPFAIAPNASGIMMVSVVVPARAIAGTYVLDVAVGLQVRDSVIVRVPRRQALEVTLVDKPGYVVSGQPYEARFVVRNRGNFPARVRVRARSTLGRASLRDTTLRVDTDASATVQLRVATPRGLSAATDDVLELTATEDSLAEARVASARVTIVPEPTRTIEEFLRMPTQVNVRAASSDAVSPYEVYGRGAVHDGGDSEIDFLFRGPTGPFSAFGERDEYRIALTAPGWRARAGDQIYLLSPLTSGAQPGFGAGIDGSYGMVRAGLHGQQFRRSPAKGTELGGFVGVGASDGLSGALNLARRQGGVLPGDVASAAAAFTGAVVAEAELARSRDTAGVGMGSSLRLSRSAGAYTIDAGLHRADVAFSGPQRGARHSHLTATGHWLPDLTFALSAGSHRADLGRAVGVPYIQTLDAGTLGATWLGRYTLELGAVDRVTAISGVRQRGSQQSVRARADHETTFGHVAVEAEVGQARDVLAERGTYNDISLGLRRTFGFGHLSTWSERYSGGSVTKGTQGTLTFGADGTMRIGRSTDASLVGYATRAEIAGAPWHSQVDVVIGRALRNGARVSLRARLIGGGSLSSAQQSVAFLEYGMPLRLPISRLRTPGRVYGRVVDAVSGRGVPGALVRLGPQVAITDGDGDVAFGGVPGGEHRLSMSQETSFADAVFVGDPTVRVDSTRVQPTTFRLAIARSARLEVDVRRFASARTGVAGAADSLADAGPLANATLMLAGERDTLYRTTRGDGQATFTDVPPGRWSVSIRGDAPAFHRFEPDRVELTLEPGETRALSFRLLPRKRDVQIIGTEQELRSEPSSVRTPSQPVPAAPRTRKPDENRPDGM